MTPWRKPGACIYERVCWFPFNSCSTRHDRTGDRPRQPLGTPRKESPHMERSLQVVLADKPLGFMPIHACCSVDRAGISIRQETVAHASRGVPSGSPEQSYSSILAQPLKSGKEAAGDPTALSTREEDSAFLAAAEAEGLLPRFDEQHHWIPPSSLGLSV